MSDALIRVSRLREEGEAAGYLIPDMDHTTIWRAAVDGRFPAVQLTNGRWYVRRSDLPKAAEAFGWPLAGEVPPASAPIPEQVAA